MNRFASVIGFLAAIALIVFVLCFFGIWIPNKPSEARYPVRGIDVSHHQGDIDWKSAKAFGIHFAYLKATEGPTSRTQSSRTIGRTAARQDWFAALTTFSPLALLVRFRPTISSPGC